MGSNCFVSGNLVNDAGSPGVSMMVDVCKTPIGNAVVPIPYCNVAKDGDLTKCCTSIKTGGNPLAHLKSVKATSSGDEPGSCGGVASGVTKGKAHYINGVNNCQVEGQPVTTNTCMMTQNHND